MDIPTFDSILALVESHGEPARCKVKNCEKCRQITFARDFYSGGEGNRMNRDHKRVQYMYTAIDERGKEKRLYTYAGMRKHVGCSDKRFSEAVNKGISVNGYVIYRDRL